MTISGTITRYAITHINHETGLRQLTFANQGRNHYLTFSAASDSALAFLENGSLRDNVLHEDVGTLEVRAAECYEHGDAVGIYFEMRFKEVEVLPPMKCSRCGLLANWYDASSTKVPKACYCTSCIKAALELQQIFGRKDGV